jgi:23S rRNA (cytosine1962-C5)-methyltransferase
LFDQQTTGYRLINGESDGWPGFVLDRYDSTLVLKLYSVASLARLEEVAGVIESVLRPERLVLRLSRNIQSIAGNRFNMQDGQVLRGSALQESVVFLESGLQFEADVLRGQKTGFFLDQRENRRRVETLARGRRVLNTFSHTGGFSLYAARGGAASVTDLDLSKRALAGAKRNYTLNRSLPDVARCRHESICADAFEWLDQPAVEKFDMIILDPPSLAKRESERAGAIRAYGRLATSGVRLLGKAGVLVAASCSAHVKSEEFFDAVRGAVIGSRRPFKEIARTAHAADHPAAFAEGHYLKCLYLQFEP